MRNIKMTIEFDGTLFHGWQRQKNKRTVQQVLEESIAKVVQENVEVIGSGRTDSGVHAMAQVAHFKTHSTLDLWNVLNGANSVLPKDVTIRCMKEEAAGFHARFDAISKVYLYQIFYGTVRPALWRDYVWFVPGTIDVLKMRQAALYLKGKHDFTSFCTVHSDAPDRIRNIMAINVSAVFPELIHVQVEADGFLRYMVRNIVGTLAEIGLGKYEPSFIKDILKAKDRAAAGPTAPAKGLFLKEVRYS